MWNDNSHLHEIPISWRHLQYFNPNKLFDCSYRFRKSTKCFQSKIVVRVQPRSSKGITDLFSPYSSLRLQALLSLTPNVLQFHHLKKRQMKIGSLKRQMEGIKKMISPPMNKRNSISMQLRSRSLYWINETCHHTNWKWPCTTLSL